MVNYLEHLFQTHVDVCLRAAYTVCNNEIVNCKIAERNRMMLLPSSEVKEITLSGNPKQTVRIRPQEILKEIPPVQELQRRYTKLNGDEQKSYEAIFACCIVQLLAAFKGKYADVLKASEGIARLQDSNYLKHVVLAQTELYLQERSKVVVHKAAL